MNTIWKAAIASLALMTGILCCTQNASADWQGTVWGMSVEAADKSFRIEHSKTPLDINACGRPGLSCLYFNYTATLEFTGWLEFRHDKLDAIHMKLEHSSQCDELMDALRRIHGKPAKESTRPFHEIMWYNEKRHNEVRVWYDTNAALGYDCNLLYTPLIRSFSVASDENWRRTP
jgi:hypothetical protein